MPIIQVQIMEGRSEDNIKLLIDDITSAAEKNLSVPKESIRVLVTEVPRNRWAVGGVLKSEENK